MICAVYARKSSDQGDRGDEAKSVTRQIERARAYAAKKGWTLAEHIYVDDGVSGAEFSRRPGYLRLLNALRPRPPFQVLVMSEESRLGREAIETAFALKQIITAGVRVFFYLEDRERTLDSPTDKIMLSLTAFADELEREKARQRTTDAMLRKAKLGHVVGGKLFGYTNVPVTSPEGQRLYVVRRIDEAQAVVVRRIFELCAQGYGKRRIAIQLNEEGAPAPRPRPDRAQGWAPASVFAVLHNPHYRGFITYNRRRKRDVWGQMRPTNRPTEEHLSSENPELRIVPEALWAAAHERLAASRAGYLRSTGGRFWGRPCSGVASKYLLMGLAVCGVCGKSFTARSRPRAGGRWFYYECQSHLARGPRICSNGWIMPLKEAEAAVLSTIEHHLLRPEVIAEAIEGSLSDLRPSAAVHAAERVDLERQLALAESELARLAAAIAEGGELEALLAALRDRERRREQLRAQLAALDAARYVANLDVGHMRKNLTALLDDWRGLLLGNVLQARQVVRKLVPERLVFEPITTRAGERVFEFRGEGRLDPILSGLVTGLLKNQQPKAVVTPAGFGRMWERQIRVKLAVA
jgi:DNA invertase Pin-like site-specific DNA recombinase